MVGADVVLARYRSVSEVTFPQLCNILVSRNKSLGTALPQGEGITQGREYQEAGVTGSSFKNCPPQGP